MVIGTLESMARMMPFIEKVHRFHRFEQVQSIIKQMLLLMETVLEMLAEQHRTSLTGQYYTYIREFVLNII